MNRWAFHSSVGAVNTTIPFQGFENGFTSLTFIEESTCIFWHDFLLAITTFGACNGGFELYYFHVMNIQFCKEIKVSYICSVYYEQYEKRRSIN